jgi:membrane protease YdiL (CAAX protease family)
MDSQAAAPPAFLRPAFLGWLGLDPRSGWILLGLFSVARVVLVLHANVAGSYALVSLLFVVMALTPIMLLAHPGRQRIGLRWRLRPFGAFAGILIGASCCAAMIASAHLLFGPGENNAFAYVARSYSGLPPVMSEVERLILFVVFALIGMTLSPLGEELFYRGLVHECFAGKIGERRAACLDAAAFALVHLAHFGLIWTAAGWALLPLPALWWLCGMFITALAFNWSRRSSGSLLGAVAAHSAFNLSMTAWIFFGIL